MAFHSVFQDNEKLKSCLISDVHHIGLNTFPISDRSGVHVELIQQALNAFARRTGLNEIVESKNFDSATASLVSAFKEAQTPKLLNYANKIDSIVGKKRLPH
jgi:hypothetical protein